jgi:suppressor of ftsI
MTTRGITITAALLGLSCGRHAVLPLLHQRSPVSPGDPPMVRAKVGQFQHWRIVNNTREIDPMHIYQAHFLAFLENDRPIRDQEWLDTVNVRVGGSVDVVMDFTDPVIRGMSVFHCHLLNHEDKGMMAKILFE